jgi:hypothetical protein
VRSAYSEFNLNMHYYMDTLSRALAMLAADSSCFMHLVGYACADAAALLPLLVAYINMIIAVVLHMLAVTG